MPTFSKFALYDFNGNPREFYLVDEIEVPKPKLDPVPSHHIVIVDRSGSMYSVMDSTKSMVEKVMTVEEFKSSELLLTLISYSSKGDYTVHFARTKVSDVLDPSKPHVASMRSIRSTCLTSVSGALEEALKHVVNTETTAISIHTDGYFNDASPASEAKAVDKWIKTVQKGHPNVYANTISYGNWTDFKMLDRISQSLSGKTVLAKTVKDVYDALHDTTSLLAGRVLPAIYVPAEDEAFLAFHNVTQRKVNGSSTDFAVKGVGPDDQTKLYRFKKVAESTWKKSPIIENTDLIPAYVFARTCLGQQRLNDAKYTLVGTRDAKLIASHYKALTSTALAEFATDLERRIAGEVEDFTQLPTVGLGFSAGSVMELCAILRDHMEDFTLDLTTFLGTYNRRGVARIEGKWVDGTFVRASTRLEPNDDASHVSVTGFDLNNTTATINMQVTRSADLIVNGEKKTVVAGKKIAVPEIRSYTIVGDGEINAPVLPLHISSKKLHAKLVEGHYLADEPFDPKLPYVLSLATLPACPFGQSFDLPTVFNRLVELTVLRSLYAAYEGTTAATEEWTPEQLVELKEHNLSPALWYVPPTTNPYTDLTTAISDGEIDSYTSYNITVGDPRMVSVKALYSANEYLARRFNVKSFVNSTEGEDLKKPKFDDVLAGGVVSIKELSARTKLNAIDDLMFPIYTAFLFGSREGDLAAVEAELEKLYAEKIRPVAFYIGASGLVPEGWDVTVLDAEGLKAKFPDIDIEKKQLEGTFLVSNDVIIGIFPEVSYFSTPKGVDKAKEIEG